MMMMHDDSDDATSVVGQQMVTANPDQSVNFFLHNPHEVYERFRGGALIYGPLGGPQGPPKKPIEKILFKKVSPKGGSKQQEMT